MFADGKMVIIGGEGSNKAHIFENSTWTSLPDLPLDSLVNHACIFVEIGQNSAGILVTGGASTFQDPVLDTYFLDWTSGRQEWVKSEPIWSPRKSHGISVIQGVLTIFGGYDFLPPFLNGGSTGSTGSTSSTGSTTKKETGGIEEFYFDAWEDTGRFMKSPRLLFAYISGNSHVLGDNLCVL
jgi:hypothetical protein